MRIGGARVAGSRLPSSPSGFVVSFVWNSIKPCVLPGFSSGAEGNAEALKCPFGFPLTPQNTPKRLFFCCSKATDGIKILKI